MNQRTPTPMENFLGKVIFRMLRISGRIFSATGRVVGAPHETGKKRAGDRDFEWLWSRCGAFGPLGLSLLALSSCGKVKATNDSAPATTVGVTKVTRKSLQRQITLSS